MTLIPFALAALFILIVFVQFGLRLLYTYRVSPEGIVILLFRFIPVWRFAMRRILSIRVVRGREKWRFLNPFTTLRLGNRLLGPTVLVELRPGWTGTASILLTPDDAETFVRDVDAALRRLGESHVLLGRNDSND